MDGLHPPFGRTEPFFFLTVIAIKTMSKSIVRESVCIAAPYILMLLTYLFCILCIFNGFEYNAIE